MSPLPGGSRNWPVVGEDGLLTKHELLYCVYLLYFTFTSIVLLYTVSQKKQDTKLLPITSPNVNRFSKFFHWQSHW